MKPISATVPENIYDQLNDLVIETDRPKGVIIRKALEYYLNDKADLLIALSRLERGEESVPFEEVEKENGLAD